TVATVTLNIPSDWSSWNCVAFAHAVAALDEDNLATVVLRVRIDGADGPSFIHRVPGRGAQAVTAAYFRSGITTAGNRTIALRGSRGSALGVSLSTVFLYARAFRTS